MMQATNVKTAKYKQTNKWQNKRGPKLDTRKRERKSQKVKAENQLLRGKLNQSQVCDFPIQTTSRAKNVTQADEKVTKLWTRKGLECSKINLNINFISFDRSPLRDDMVLIYTIYTNGTHLLRF